MDDDPKKLGIVNAFYGTIVNTDAITTLRGVYGTERVRRRPAAIKPYANTRRKKKKGGVISKENEEK